MLLAIAWCSAGPSFWFPPCRIGPGGATPGPSRCGQIAQPIARGLYRRRGRRTTQAALIEIAVRAPEATLCLTTALALHQLCDFISPITDVALPRGRHRPATGAPVAWHAFDRATFDIGRGTKHLEENLTIGLYGPERSIIDALRLRHREGNELAYDALKRWMRRKGSSPAALLEMARRFPQAERAVREALAVLS